MGLAPFGRPRPDLPSLVGVRDGRTWALDAWPEWLCHPWTVPDEGPAPDWEKSPHVQEWKDLSWRVQQDLEEALIVRARELHAKTGMRNLVMAGGVALNCVANGRIVRETPFERVWVQPAAGDTGIALGCALLRRTRLGEAAATVRDAPRLPRADVHGRRDRRRHRGAPVRHRSCARARSDDVAGETAKALARGEVVGWFQGGAELGPRALGHRSILADRASRGAKDRLNSRVKHRQAFRPFAPAVLVEKMDEWFEPGPASPHMLLVRRVLAEKVAKIPAIVHVDGTARLQTVAKRGRPALPRADRRVRARDGRARDPQHVVQRARRAHRGDAAGRAALLPLDGHGPARDGRPPRREALGVPSAQAVPLRTRTGAARGDRGGSAARGGAAVREPGLKAPAAAGETATPGPGAEYASARP